MACTKNKKTIRRARGARRPRSAAPAVPPRSGDRRPAGREVRLLYCVRLLLIHATRTRLCFCGVVRPSRDTPATADVSSALPSGPRNCSRKVDKGKGNVNGRGVTVAGGRVAHSDRSAISKSIRRYRLKLRPPGGALVVTARAQTPACPLSLVRSRGRRRDGRAPYPPGHTHL